MTALYQVAVSCVSRFAAARKEDRFAVALNKDRIAAGKCPEHERLESEFAEARDRFRALSRLRQLTQAEEKVLLDRVAMAIARMKEHAGEHGCKR